MPAEIIRVTGLREFDYAIRRVGSTVENTMKTRLLRIVGVIAGRVAAVVPTGPSGRARGSVTSRATAQGAAVLAGGSRAPYFGWLDFGGSTGRGHQRGPNMGAIHRTWMGRPRGEGRYLYPQVSAAREETIDALDDAIRDVAEAAGFDTSGHV